MPKGRLALGGPALPSRAKPTAQGAAKLTPVSAAPLRATAPAAVPARTSSGRGPRGQAGGGVLPGGSANIPSLRPTGKQAGAVALNMRPYGKGGRFA